MIAKDRDITFSLFTMLSLILVPVVHPSMMCLAYLPTFVIFSRLQGRMTTPLGGVFMLGAMLAFAPGMERIAPFANRLGPVVFYPRLFGGVILTALLFVLEIESKRASLLMRGSDSVSSPATARTE
jgi:hypothetical protein